MTRDQMINHLILHGWIASNPLKRVNLFVLVNRELGIVAGKADSKGTPRIAKLAGWATSSECPWELVPDDQLFGAVESIRTVASI